MYLVLLGLDASGWVVPKEGAMCVWGDLQKGIWEEREGDCGLDVK